MRYLILLFLSVSCLQMSQAQIYEIGIFAGASNFIGDVGQTDYISPQEPAIGILAKWNRSPRHSWRVSVIYSNLIGRDLDSEDPRRLERGYTFENDILEVSAGMEFNFLDFNLHEMDRQYSPYLYTGITIANHDNYYFGPNGQYISENTSSWAYGIPMILGFKGQIADQLVIAGEIGARYTFSDELDGSKPDDRFRQDFAFGNTNSNDWYVFTGVTLTYTFGEKPCYCNF